jgi:hypothetical protein
MERGGSPPSSLMDMAAGGDHSYYGDISTQPGMSDYYDPITHMPKILDASQAAEQGGTSLQGLAAGFFPQQGAGNFQGYNPPSDQGGFFNAEDLYRQLGRDVPKIGTLGQAGPSTNNWRLLGMGPGWILRNGSLIDTNSAGGRYGGPAGWSSGGGNSGEQFVAGAGFTALGGGSGYGVPNMLQAGLAQPITFGWPGADHWIGAGGWGGLTT